MPIPTSIFSRNIINNSNLACIVLLPNIKLRYVNILIIPAIIIYILITEWLWICFDLSF